MSESLILTLKDLILSNSQPKCPPRGLNSCTMNEIVDGKLSIFVWMGEFVHIKIFQISDPQLWVSKFSLDRNWLLDF